VNDAEVERVHNEDQAQIAEQLVGLERTLVAAVFFDPSHVQEASEIAPSCDFVDRNVGQLFEAIAIIQGRGEAVAVESVIDTFSVGEKKNRLEMLCEIADEYTSPVDPLWLAKLVAKEHAQAESRRERAPVLVCMADVEPQEVDFLWLPYLPKGKLALLEGDPGLGKTYLALAIAAAVSRGFPLPGSDGVPCGHGLQRASSI